MTGSTQPVGFLAVLLCSAPGGVENQQSHPEGGGRRHREGAHVPRSPAAPSVPLCLCCVPAGAGCAPEAAAGGKFWGPQAAQGGGVGVARQ